MAKKLSLLQDFKKTIKLTPAVYKKPKFVELNPAIQEVLKLPGLPMGHISVAYGLSDTGKTTLLMEGIKACQEQGILPVVVLTGPEKKVDWNRARAMGVKYTGDLPEDQQTDDFIIVNESLDYIEDVFEFLLNDIFNNVEQGKLPYDVQIFWDSAGNTLCRAAVSVDKKTGKVESKDMHMKAAKILGEQLLLASDRIANSRKETRPNYVGMFYITSTYPGQPAWPGAPVPMIIKGGNKVKFTASLMIRHTLVSKLSATKDGDDLKFGMITRLAVTKNHINGQEYTGDFVVTEDEILANEKAIIDDYKERKSDKWGAFDIVAEASGEVFEGVTKRKIGVTLDKKELED